MSCAVWSKAFVAGCAAAVALSAGACNRDEAADVDRDTDRLATADTADRKEAGHEGAPITVTGCLQRGGGINNYILTQVNSPSDSPVATSGKSNEAAGNAVEREQMRGAKHAYALDGEIDDARDLVGKQVRVTGKLAETSDIQRESTARSATDLDANDLAKIDVQQMAKVADTCGNSR